MNEDLYNYISRLISQGCDNHESLKTNERKIILGYILKDREEPILFLTETNCHKRFIHKFVSYLTKDSTHSFTTILDIYDELFSSAMDYHYKRINETFDEAKVIFMESAQ